MSTTGWGVVKLLSVGAVDIHLTYKTHDKGILLHRFIHALQDYRALKSQAFVTLSVRGLRLLPPRKLWTGRS